MNIILLALGALALAMAPAAQAADADAMPQWQRVELGSGAQRYPFAFYGNKPWSGDLREIKSVVLIFHGLGRNGAGYYSAAQKRLVASGVNVNEVLVIAPQYFNADDGAKHALEGMPLWRGSRWNRGEDAVNWPWPLSSFQPIDDLLAALLDKARFPRLAQIVIAGHSAGGQIVHRYAVLNDVDEKVRAAGVQLRYVIANPSSYLYFNHERPAASGFVPYDAAICTDFNRYRYGLKNLVRHAARADTAVLFARYAARDVTYLLGSADNNPAHSSLDKSCGAQAQGTSRLARGRNYLRYERHLAGLKIKLNRQAFEVIGVAHSQARMFGSQCGVVTLFGAAAASDGAACRAPQ